MTMWALLAGRLAEGRLIILEKRTAAMNVPVQIQEDTKRRVVSMLVDSKYWNRLKACQTDDGVANLLLDILQDCQRQLEHIENKAAHGCTDAYCEECDE